MSLNEDQVQKIETARNAARQEEIGHLNPSKTKAWKGAAFFLIGAIPGHYFKSEELKKVERRGNTAGSIAAYKEAEKLGVSVEDKAKLWGDVVKDHTLEVRHARISKNLGAFGGPVGWVFGLIQSKLAERGANKESTLAQDEYMRLGQKPNSAIHIDDISTQGTPEQQIRDAKQIAHDRVIEKFSNVSKNKGWKGLVFGSQLWLGIGSIIGAVAGRGYKSEELKDVERKADFAGAKEALKVAEKLGVTGNEMNRVKADFAKSLTLDAKHTRITKNMGFALSLPGLVVSATQEKWADRTANKAAEKASRGL